MQKDKKLLPVKEKAQTTTPTKKQPVIETSAAPALSNTAQQTPGLNQSKTKREDLLPLD